MQQREDEIAIARLRDELIAGRGSGIERALVEEALGGALRDLKGSVPPPALPEMAARLTAERLLRRQPA